ncbi:transposase-like protein [Hirsutella rhossiliensis]
MSPYKGGVPGSLCYGQAHTSLDGYKDVLRWRLYAGAQGGRLARQYLCEAVEMPIHSLLSVVIKHTELPPVIDFIMLSKHVAKLSFLVEKTHYTGFCQSGYSPKRRLSLGHTSTAPATPIISFIGSTEDLHRRCVRKLDADVRNTGASRDEREASTYGTIRDDNDLTGAATNNPVYPTNPALRQIPMIATLMAGTYIDDSDLISGTAASPSPAPSSSPVLSVYRRKTSPIWQYCRREEGRSIPAAWVDSNGTKWWHCQPCFDKKRAKKYNYCGGSSAIVNHLRKEHNIIISGRQETRREVTQSRLGDITAFLANGTLVSTKKRKATAEVDALDQATLRELYCRYTVACSLSFAHVEQPAFRDFIRYIRPAADDLLPRGVPTYRGTILVYITGTFVPLTWALLVTPRSGDTVKNDLQWGYDNKKEFVKRALQNALSSIHIVPDNWTSPNCLGVIGFTVQFVTEDHGLQSLVVRIKELEGQHSGENMAEAIMEFIREYGIATKVGYFMMDNATNMNTMIDKVSDDLEHEFEVFYDPLPHRLRCFGHIINLAVMEFLMESDHPQQIPTTDPRAIGKLHNIVVYITWTPQRLQTFTGLTDGLRLRRDNDTRWNSWHSMVEWALRTKVRQGITIFCAQEPALQDDALTSSDWVTLAEIHKFLEPFHDATMANEGTGNSISDVLPTMDYLLHHIEAAKEATTIPHLATMMETTWAKLADYYELTEDSPVYSAATVLNPSLKWAYMEKTWDDKNEWIERAKARVGELWREAYKSTTPALFFDQLPHKSQVQDDQMAKATIFNMDDDEYEVYCREPVVMSQRSGDGSPNLSLMAIDLLSIAPMSTETERLFSKAKLSVTDQRGSMNIETLNLLNAYDPGTGAL